ncbi:MAG: YraN family protein [Acidimicrobiia bacterium]
MADPRRAVGAAGEDAVAEWYRAQGYAVLDRNWRVREGELDVVVGRAGTIVFCEVKTRRTDAFGAPAEAVTARKQARLRKLGRLWLAAHDTRAAGLRFDVAAVTPNGRGWTVEVLEAAF